MQTIKKVGEVLVALGVAHEPITRKSVVDRVSYRQLRPGYLATLYLGALMIKTPDASTGQRLCQGIQGAMMDGVSTVRVVVR